MANLWLSVLVLVFVHGVVGVQRNCQSLEKLNSCDECIRCGGNWCIDPGNSTGEQRCIRTKYDKWCLGKVNQLKLLPQEEPLAGEQFNYKFRQRSVPINQEDEFVFQYSSKLENPKISLNYNSTQSSDIEITNSTECANSICSTTIMTRPSLNFCGHNGSPDEFYSVKLSVEGIKEEATMKLHVPCACSCSSVVEENSKSCSGRGRLVCGTCDCPQGWTGNHCETQVCVKEDRRGDTPCRDEGADKDCWGNGKCGQCDKCECFTDREGSRYFDRDNYCADICMLTNDCEDCFVQPEGECTKYQQSSSGRCNFALTRLPFNESALEQRDSLNRSIWVKCVVTELFIEYIVMRDDGGKTFFMILESVTQGQAGGVAVTVPIVVVVLGVLAAGAAVAGYMMWKNRTPPVPYTDPNYQNIDAEDCTGENPLYRPPTSSFKNPTYGKW